jgi:hypothetical protein
MPFSCVSRTVSESNLGSEVAGPAVGADGWRTQTALWFCGRDCGSFADCANVANLILARRRRQREIVIRLPSGKPLGVRQLLSKAVVGTGGWFRSIVAVAGIAA